jgi:hypothetical protein
LLFSDFLVSFGVLQDFEIKLQYFCGICKEAGEEVFRAIQSMGVRADVACTNFNALMATDTLNPSILSPIGVLRGRGVILKIWP